MEKDLPISGLPSTTSLEGNELFVIVQDGITKHTTLNVVNTSTTSNYGLYNQTGSSTPVIGSIANVPTSGSLLDGGIGTLTIPANVFKKGDAFHARLSGKITISNNHTLDIHFRSGNVLFVDAGPITMTSSTNKNWSLETTFIIQEIGPAGIASVLSSGELTIRTNSSNDTITEIFSSKNNTTFDTTINNTLYIEGILGAACTASENIYSELFILHKIY
jgi:hypothetical protein